MKTFNIPLLIPEPKDLGLAVKIVAKTVLVGISVGLSIADLKIKEAADAMQEPQRKQAEAQAATG